MSETNIIDNNYENETFIQSIYNFNKSLDKSMKNNDISKSVKRLLSMSQSFCKRHPINGKPLSLITNKEFLDQMMECLTKLEKIILFEESFAETSVLSSLGIAFALIILCDVKKAIHLYFKLFSKQSFISKELIEYKIDNNLINILRDEKQNYDLTQISLLSGLLSCNYFIDYLIEFQTKVFIQIHYNIIKICDKKLIHEFQVFKLLQNWFLVFNNNCKHLALKEPNFLDNKTIIENTLRQIDYNWEHPINGVKDCIKIIYNLILETFIAFKSFVLNNRSDDKTLLSDYDLITEEVIKTSQLSLTSKAKYRKMSALIPFIGWKRILESDPNLSSQMFNYLSINSLSTSINELYKTIIVSLKKEETEDILNIWSKYFLENLCFALKSKNKVIHNNLRAHLLPFTLKNIENSIHLVLESLKGSPIAEVVVVRTAIDYNLPLNFSNSFSWFQFILLDNEEMVREEALSLIIDERYIKDRDKVFDLFLYFLLSNINVDNPSFRQRVISKIDKFVNRICISLSHKFGLYQTYDESDLRSVQFLKDYSNIIVSNLLSGASFQRRITCLLLFDSFLTITSKYNLKLNDFLNLSDAYFLILISVIDKDDNIRKLSTNVLIKFNKSYHLNEYDLNTIAKIGVNFLNSPRHQESHSGGLIMKYIINCFAKITIDDKLISNELDLIEFFVKSAQNQSKVAKQNFLVSAKTEPIHGFILALNNCLSSETLKKFVKNDRIKTITNDSIELCFDCIEQMLQQLSKSNIESSPSFQQMFESLKTIINEQNVENEYNSDDISASNDYQLLLSMCWLNIKECSFLLSNFVQLSQQLEEEIIPFTTVHKIGSQLINILSKCRHKGVIEATCIALTSYTVSLIKAKTKSKSYIYILNQLLEDSLNFLSKSALNSSITRRSAGLALTIQAILTGESEAFSQGFKLDNSLFNQTIDQLIETADIELPQNIDIKSDLPQTYALHILKSIVMTASLSRFTLKIVERLLPICIKGFSSDIWQIRNASLQLFGSCSSRMLGQPKLSDVNQLMSDGTTISSNELFSRYPTLLETFKSQFEKSFIKLEQGYFTTELVPVLAFLASFSPLYSGKSFCDQQLISYLIRLLSNKIWKIRMLSAKALSSLLPINRLEKLLYDLISQQNLNCNSIHGLILSVNHLLELKQQNNDSDYQKTRDRFLQIFQKLINENQNCYVLNDIFKQIFFNITLPFDSCDTEKYDKQEMVENKIESNLSEFLDKISSKVEFDKSDDIRLFAANSLNSKLKDIIEEISIPKDIFKMVDIILSILEDEDRTVRKVGEKIVSEMIHKTEANCFIHFNIAIDCVLKWLIQNPLISPQELTDYLFIKIESNISMTQLIESLFNGNEVLFEKEEKNVFAEPLFQLFKFSECLRIVITKYSTKISSTHLKKLIEDCNYFEEQLPSLNLQRLVSFSIWKLPKLFVCLCSLYLRTDIILNTIYGSKEEQITESFDGLNLLDFEKQLIGLSTEQLKAMNRSHDFLSNKFGFLSILKQNSLFKISF